MLEMLRKWFSELKFFNFQSGDSISSFSSLSDIRHTIEQVGLALSKKKYPEACCNCSAHEGTDLTENGDSKSNICKCSNCTVLPNLTECGVCLEPLQGYGCQSCPVCSNLICGRCASRITSCAFCRTPLPMQRNRAFERLLDRLILPCKNWRFGCDVRLNPENRFEHESICHFSLTFCPHDLNNCRSRGLIGEIESHMKTVHQLEVLQDFGFNVQVKNFHKRAETWQVQQYSVCLSCYDQLFYAKITIAKRKLKLFVIKLGYTKKIPIKYSIPKYGVSIWIYGSCRTIKVFLPFEKNLCDTRELVIRRKKLYSDTSDIDDKDLFRIDLCVKHQ